MPDETTLPAGVTRPAGPWRQNWCDPAATRQSVSGADMSASFVILTTAVNSHGNAHRITPTDQGGGLLTDFHQTAPIVLFEHGFGNLQFPVLGLSRDKAGGYTVQKSPERATATVYFDQHNPDAAAVFGMVESGTLGMASIGFNAVLVMEREQPAQRPLPAGVHQVGGEYRGVLFTETRLQEWSIVAQGADPGAVRQHLDKGSVNGHRFSERLTQCLRQYADPVPVQGRGWSPPEVTRTIEQAGVTISGTPEAVSSFLSGLRPAQPSDDPGVDRSAIPGSLEGVAPSLGDAACSTSGQGASSGGCDLDAVVREFERRLRRQDDAGLTQDALGLALDRLDALAGQKIGAVVEESRRVAAELERISGAVA